MWGPYIYINWHDKLKVKQKSGRPCRTQKKERKQNPITTLSYKTMLVMLGDLECNNYTIHFRTGERIAAIEQVFVSESQILTTNYM